MFPYLSVNNCPNACRSNFVTLRKFCPHELSYRVESSYFNYLRSRQLCSCALFPLTAIKSALYKAIRYIVFLGSLEKVKWIAAWRIVARMADRERWIDASACQSKSNSLGVFHTVENSEPAVTILSTRTFPSPTFIHSTNIDFRPKTDCYTFGKLFNLFLHNQFVWLCHALGCSFTARAFSLCGCSVRKST